MRFLARRSLRWNSSKPRLEFLEDRLNPGVIAFSQAQFNVAATASTITVQMVRTGDTRATETVNLVSTNGTAVAPTDFNAVNGTITFGPSDTSVPLQIVLHPNGQTGNRRFTLDLQSPGSGATLGTITHATVTIVDTTSQVARYVTQLYQTLLTRTPDLGGLAFFSDQINSGAVSRQSVARTLLGSDEYRTTQLTGLYQTILGRAPDAGGLSFALGELNHGFTYEQIEAQFYSSAEYFAKIGSGAPDNDQTRNWIDALFSAVLNRHAESGALTGLAPTAGTGASGRGSVAVTILGSSEGDQVRVQGYYQAYLHRAGDSGGVSAWVQQMQAGTRDEDIIAAFLGSAEFFAGV